MNKKVQEAKLRYENSKELFERAGRIFDRDLNAYVAAMDEAKVDEAANPTTTPDTEGVDDGNR